MLPIKTKFLQRIPKGWVYCETWLCYFYAVHNFDEC